MTAGDPDGETTLRILKQSEEAGADLVELGFPFSDPVADGPTIQASYSRALENGQKNEDIFQMVGKLRQTSEIPVVAMISYSLIYKMGFDGFIERALYAGIDGATVPDLPAEEMQEFLPLCEKAGFHLISFVTPATNLNRRKLLLSISKGFVYYIAVRGITGERESMPEDLRENLLQLKTETTLPLAVGFGISSPIQAQAVAALADAVIVGSAIVKRIHNCRLKGQDPSTEALRFIKKI